MMIINKDILLLFFSKIKEEVSKVNFVELYNNGEFFKFINLLNKDKRKNVLFISSKF